MIFSYSLFLHSTLEPYRIDIQDVRMKEKIKKLEIKLRKNIELNEQSQAAKKQSNAKSDIRDVIRRRKGKPDKRISLNVNRGTD